MVSSIGMKKEADGEGAVADVLEPELRGWREVDPYVLLLLLLSNSSSCGGE